MTQQELYDLNGKMKPFDTDSRDRAVKKWNSLAKPLGSLGVLEDVIADIAGMTGSLDVRLNRPLLYVVCADNGVVCEGVSQCGSEATAAVARALAAGESTVNYMTAGTGLQIIPVDAGMKDFGEAPGIRELRIRNLTGNIAVESAMTPEETLQAIENGIMLTKEAREKGYDILLTGEMGIGNTTTSSALCSVLLKKDPEEVTGRGAGLSDEGLEKKTGVVKRAAERYYSLHKSDNISYIDLLSELGGLDIAVLTGICIGGGLYGMPILLDGFITLTAALTATKITPGCAKYLIAGHISSEPAASMIIKELHTSPFIDAGMRLGEGTGAVAALRLLQMSADLYNSGHTFDELGIESYKCLS